MIYVNGYVSEVLYPPVTFDSSGRPLESEPTEGCRLACMWRAVTDDKRGEGKDNRSPRASYEVHINPTIITAERMRLYGLNGELMGEFPVQSWQTATLLGFTTIQLG